MADNTNTEGNWFERNWHWAAGVGAGGAGGGLLGSTIGGIFGEDTWFQKAMTWAGALLGAVGGAFLAGEIKGDERLKNAVASQSETAGSALDEVSEKINALKEVDMQQSYDDLLKELGELSEEGQTTLKEALDKLDGKEDGVVKLSDIPAAQYTAAKTALKSAYSASK